MTTYVFDDAPNLLGGPATHDPWSFWCRPLIHWYEIPLRSTDPDELYLQYNTGPTGYLEIASFRRFSPDGADDTPWIDMGGES